MPTRVRNHRRNFNEPGHAHELTFTCYQGYPFFKSERTCQWLAEAIDEARSIQSFALWAYVFMPNHIHLIVFPKTSLYDISQILAAIKQPVARRAIAWLRKNDPDWITKLARRRGKRTETHFWQSGGGYDRNITDVETLLKMIDYLQLNPVRKNLVREASQYKWSSASCLVSGIEGPIGIDPIPSYWLAM